MAPELPARGAFSRRLNTVKQRRPPRWRWGRGTASATIAAAAAAAVIIAAAAAAAGTVIMTHHHRDRRWRGMFKNDKPVPALPFMPGDVAPPPPPGGYSSPYVMAAAGPLTEEVAPVDIR